MADTRKQSNTKDGRRKIVPYRRVSRLPSGINIGTILFGVILIYLVIILIVFLSRDHVTAYEVVSGTLSGNYRYRALALKTEEVVKASEGGTVTYYARDASKANSGMLICSVGGPSAASSAGVSLTTSLSDEDTSDVLNTLATFSAGASADTFSDVYDVKADLKGIILQSSIDENAGTYVSGSYLAPESGFVLYHVDGYENLDESRISSGMLEEQSYRRDNLRTHTTVSAGDDLYKLVTSDDWNLYIPLTDSLKTKLEGQDSVRVRFLKDGNTFSAGFSIVRGEDGYYGKISLTSSLVRYVSDRFLDIELVMNQAEGLKIPTSAIVKREFYEIPGEYVIVNASTETEVTFRRLTYRSDGSEETSTVTATVYAKNTEDNTYLVDATLLDDGDNIIMPGTSKKFQVNDSVKTTIQGVYNINKGYAVFREVNIVDQNEEYCIVDPSNIYGLAAHDRIALDASQVTEDQITV